MSLLKNQLYYVQLDIAITTWVKVNSHTVGTLVFTKGPFQLTSKRSAGYISLLAHDVVTVHRKSLCLDLV